MGSEKPGSEVLQDAFLKKEGPDRKKEGWKVSPEICIALMMIAHLSSLQKEKGNTTNFQNVDGYKFTNLIHS